MINKITGLANKTLALLFNPKVFILIFISGIIYFGFLQTGSLFGGGNPSVDGVGVNLISESPTENVYDFYFNGEGILKSSSCDQVSDTKFNFNVKSIKFGPISDWPDNLIGGTYETTDVVFQGVSATANMCSDNEYETPFQFYNVKAVCLVYNERGKVDMSCDFMGGAKTNNGIPARFYGLTGGTARLTIPKDYQPSQTDSQPDPTPDTPSPTGKISILKQIEDFFNKILFKIKSFFARFR